MLVVPIPDRGLGNTSHMVDLGDGSANPSYSCSTPDQDERELVRQALNVGYEYLAGRIGMEEWQEAGGEVSTLDLIRPRTLIPTQPFSAPDRPPSGARTTSREQPTSNLATSPPRPGGVLRTGWSTVATDREP